MFRPCIYVRVPHSGGSVKLARSVLQLEIPTVDRVGSEI